MFLLEDKPEKVNTKKIKKYSYNPYLMFSCQILIKNSSSHKITKKKLKKNKKLYKISYHKRIFSSLMWIFWCEEQTRVIKSIMPTESFLVTLQNYFEPFLKRQDRFYDRTSLIKEILIKNIPIKTFL